MFKNQNQDLMTSLNPKTKAPNILLKLIQANAFFPKTQKINGSNLSSLRFSINNIFSIKSKAKTISRRTIKINGFTINSRLFLDLDTERRIIGEVECGLNSQVNR